MSIRLQPVRHSEPRCADFADEALVVEYERAMRTHRAYVESFVVEPLARGRRDVAYRVASAAGAPYIVDIVDDSGAHDGCTCADFLANQLGTCKHLEAVRRALLQAPSLRRLPAVNAPPLSSSTRKAQPLGCASSARRRPPWRLGSG